MNYELIFSLRAKTSILASFLFEKSIGNLSEEDRVIETFGKRLKIGGIIQNYKEYEAIICENTEQYLGDFRVAFSEDGYSYVGILVSGFPFPISNLDKNILEPLLQTKIFEKEIYLYPYCHETFSVEYNPYMDLT